MSACGDAADAITRLMKCHIDVTSNAVSAPEWDASDGAGDGTKYPPCLGARALGRSEVKGEKALEIFERSPGEISTVIAGSVKM